MQSLIYFKKHSWFRELPASITQERLTNISHPASIWVSLPSVLWQVSFYISSWTRKLSKFSVRSPLMWATLITLASELSSTYLYHFIKKLIKTSLTRFRPLITSAMNFIDHSLYGIINRDFPLNLIACKSLSWILL